MVRESKWSSAWEPMLRLLDEYVVPATGCTEPISTALAAAHAAELLGEGEITRIEVRVSANLMKNAMAVGVPGTGRVGLPMAAAIGAIGGNAELGLQVLDQITESQVAQATLLADSGNVTVQIADVDSVLYSDVEVYSGKSQARVVIRDGHTRVVLKKRDGQVLFLANTPEQGEQCAQQAQAALNSPLSIAQIYQFATEAPFERLRFILRAAEINSALSASGLSGEHGLQVGLTLQRNIQRGLLSDDLTQRAMVRAASASDARMDGVPLPAMSNSGSGNQGITATMPVVSVAEQLGKSQESLARALILSHLIAIHIKLHLNPLSALCGAVTAGIGASCGITWLLGGELDALERAVANMTADMSGVFCDGAKPGCALKVSSSTNAAIKAALLALEGIRVTGEQGIVDTDLEQTIDNLGKLGNQAMQQTDAMIIDIMTHK